ncbi:MAG: hypothetical protein J5I94_07505, partial [Phaeodactylibacter sp.]|nr:hypothetical protein [Phaeodactylibacter sp.]
QGKAHPIGSVRNSLFAVRKSLKIKGCFWDWATILALDKVGNRKSEVGMAWDVPQHLGYQ